MSKNYVYVLSKIGYLQLNIGMLRLAWEFLKILKYYLKPSPVLCKQLRGSKREK